MIRKGKVSTVLEGGKAVTVTPYGGGTVTTAITVPFFLIGALPVGTPVSYVVFDDNTGIVLSRMDGGGNDGASSQALHTTLSRASQGFHVHCHGLTPGEKYAIHLYTVVRRKGNRQDVWRHPDNTNSGNGFTGKGYGRLAGQYWAGAKDRAQYPQVPAWMPNGGILQTEWEFTAQSDTFKKTIAFHPWILPMLKPVDGESFENGCGLIGVDVAQSAPLLFRFKLVHLGSGAIGESSNTLRVGMIRGEPIPYDPEMRFYSSII